jgi:transposase
MTFGFYPQHEYRCPHVGSCPHVGGAALGTLVACANENQAVQEARQRVLEAERATKTQLLGRIAALEVELEQTQAELRLERRGKFRPAEAAESDESLAAAVPTPERETKKRGAPVGHPGWFRPRPVKADRTVAVAAPSACPHCGGAVRVYDQLPVEEHFQEDLSGSQCQTTCFQHPQARCVVCRRWVQQAGEGELLGQRIGPQARARAIWLRDHVGLTWRKGARVLEGLLGLKVSPAALLGFEVDLAQKAAPVVADIEQKLGACEGAVHSDGTGWPLDGESAAFWFHGDERLAHFHFDESRAGEVSRGILGDDFAGTLVTDCSTVYWQHAARWKQKCLAHLRRTAGDWKAVVGARPLARQFFEDVKAWVHRGCEFHRQRRKGRLTSRQSAAEKRWLREELERLEQCLVDHPKAATLQARLRTYHDDWLVFLEHPEVPPTNNLAEQALRPLVILRKLTYGSRSRAGAKRLAHLLTVMETAKRHGHDVLAFLYKLQLRSPGRLLRYLYDTR